MTLFKITPCLLIVILMNAIAIGQDSTGIPPLEESGIKVSASVDKKEIPLNRNVTLTIQVSWSGGLDRYEIDEFENPVVRNLEIVGTSSSNRVTGGDKPMAVKEYQLILRPVELGMGYIESAIITYHDRVLEQNQRLVTNRLDVKVIDSLPEPGEMGSGWIVFVVVFVLLGAGAIAFILLQKKRRERQATEEAEVLLPMEELYLQELKETVDLSATELDVGQGFSTLSRFYRKFLSEKFVIRALEATTEDVVNSLSEAVADERFINNTKEILNACDVAKFSGEAGSKSELERVYTLIESNLERSLRGELEAPAEEQAMENEQE